MLGLLSAGGRAIKIQSPDIPCQQDLSRSSDTLPLPGASFAQCQGNRDNSVGIAGRSVVQGQPSRRAIPKHQGRVPRSALEEGAAHQARNCAGRFCGGGGNAKSCSICVRRPDPQRYRRGIGL